MPSPEQILKELADGVKRDFEEFKGANDKRLKLLEEKGHAPADLGVKVDRISEGLTKTEEKIEALKTVMERAPSPALDPATALKADEKAASESVTSFMRKGDPGSKEQRAAYLRLMEAHLGGKKNSEFRELEEKVLSVGSDPAGGYFVAPFISSEISKKVFESSPIREISGGITISTDRFEELANYSEPGSGWVGEQASRPATSNSTLSKLQIPVHELYAMPVATQSIIDDSAVNIEAWHAGEVVEKFARDEATAFVSGNGVNKPKGILSYTAGDGFNLVEQVVSGFAATIDGDSLVSVQDALLEPFQNGATWVMRRATLTIIRKLKDGEGRYLLSAGGGLLEGKGYQLLGKPVRLAADMPVIAANSLSIAYGDFKQGYMVVDRVGIRVLRDPFTNKPSVQFYTTKRVGGGVRKFQAVKLLKCSV